MTENTRSKLIGSAGLFVLMTLVILAFSIIVSGGGQQAPSLSFFHAVGRDLVSDSTGQKTAFRGVNLNGLEYGNFEGNPYPGVEGTNYFKARVEDYDAVQALGSNVIRVPFEWARLVPGWTPSSPLPADLNSTYLALLDEVVQRASVRQIYVIFDMHDFLKYWSGLSAQICVDSEPSYQQLLARTWKLLAAHFSNNPGVLGFDLQNEPVRKEASENCESCNWHTISQSIVDEIRTVDGMHLIFVEGPNYSLASNWRIENGQIAFITDRVAPSRIAYSPHVFFDLDNDSIYSDAEMTGPIGRWEYYVRDRLQPMIQWGRDNNVPIYVGEVNVPCSANWTPVLEAAFNNYFDPLHISVTAWHYINPTACPLDRSGCALNLAACPQRYQLNVIAQHPGGTYGQTGNLVLSPSDSRLYDDSRVNPWDSGAGFFDDSGNPGIAVSFSATSPVFEGNRSIGVSFTRNNFAAVKFSYSFGIDARQFKALVFRIFLTGSGQQNFKVFSTNPRSDCQHIQNPGGSDPIYPPQFNQQPVLRTYLSSPTPAQWMRVEIPLTDIVDPLNSIINGIALQNMGTSQADFYLDDVRLLPQYLGYLDATGCGIISGWAWTANQQDAVIPVDLYDGANFITMVSANLYREDIVNAGIGDGFHGFSFTVPASLKNGQPHTIHAYFGGSITELGNSPRSLTCNNIAPSYQGYHDGAGCNTISGWAWNITDPDNPINVDIYDGANLIATVPALQFRPDLVNAGIGNGFHGFAFTLPASLKDGQPHSIRVRFPGTNTDLGNTPRTIGCSGAPPVYQGYHDGADCDAISGWAWDTHDPESPINVAIFADGNLIATVLAIQFRQDLANAGIGNGYHAFSFNTPASLKNGQPHSILVRFSGSATSLTNSPKTITCAP